MLLLCTPSFGRRQAGGEAPAAVRPRVFLRTCPPGFNEASWETRAGKVGAAGGRGRWTSPMPAWTAWSAMTGSSGGAGSGEEGKRRPRRNELIFLFDWRKEQS
ncbi:hypothetical protein DAI22_02g217800 [Oryza sativa Japonica Group]|nr:hypothetical protein DAI22_02g217800 [Oryza sativa Japonica Group]